MKRLLLVVILLSNLANAQPFHFLNLRYDEDYSHLRNDSSNHWYNRMKFNPVSGSGYLSAGGEIRYQTQYYRNEDWSNTPKPSYNAFYTRFLFHTDLQFGAGVRIFTQLASTFAEGRITPERSIDENQFNVHQLFVDWNFPEQTTQLTIRFGRQELLYGSQRLIAVREGPNNRQSFDAIKFMIKRGDWKIDLYYGRPVRIFTGALDDEFNKNVQVWSLYAVKIFSTWHADLYYIGLQHREKTFLEGNEHELRHSVGTRIWRKKAPWSVDFEALYQFGSFGDSQISAYTASLNAAYVWDDLPLNPAIGLKTEIISGDRKTNDDRLNTFNPLFPRGAYFGLAALIGPSNLVDFHPSLSIAPSEALDFNMDYDLFWRYSTNDGIYGPNVTLIYGASSSNSFIGQQLGLSMEYRPSAFLTITPELMWFFAGPYLKDVSPGKNVSFAAITIQLKY